MGFPSGHYSPNSDAPSGNDEYLGQTGYINRTSGWANAEGAMRTIMQRILSHRPRITLRRGKVSRLLFSKPTNENNNIHPSISGVLLTDSSTITANLTILATGAWTPTLLNLTGHIQPTAQCLAYLPLTAREAASLSNMPVLLNLSH
ncbi:MAG: hypothetical protein Q9224_001473, partial [Gallowayella concinna]